MLLDEVYKLTVSVMRQGMNPLCRFHNLEFANDVLLAGEKLEQSPNSQ